MCKRSGSLFRRWGSIFLILTAAMFLIAGCGSDDDEDDVICGDGDGGLCTLSSDADPVEEGVGVFLDGPVQGLEFAAGDLSGITKEDGSFTYAEGDVVTFKIGEIVLGQGTAKSEMTPIDLVEGGSVDHTEVVNMIRFLQTLDEDRDPSNGIVITEAVRENAVDPFDFASAEDSDLRAVVAQLDPSEPELVSASDAKEHFRCTLVTIPGSETNEKMNTLLQSIVEQTESPGAVMIIQQDDERRWVGTSGVADKDTERPITECDKFRIASITKTFTAVGILQLIHEEKLGLEDTLESLLPGALPAEFQPEKITVAMMLNHSSGLNNFANDSEYGDDAMLRPNVRYTPEELIEISNALGPVAAPGQIWRYSNTNYVLLGLIIEKLTGMSWEDYTRQFIIEEVGLNSTIIPERGDVCIPGAYSKGYLDYMIATEEEFRGIEGVLSDHTKMEPSVAWSSGSMVSSPWDLVQWIKYVVKDDIYETFLKTDEYNAEVPSEIPPPSLYWGLGFMKDKNYGLMGHVGQFHGYDSFVAYRFKNRLAMAVSVNRTLLHDFPTLPVVKMHNDKSGNSRVFIYNAIELLKGNENPLIAKTEAEESAEPRTGTVR